MKIPGHAIRVAWRGAGVVRRDHDVAHVPQGRVGGQGLPGEYVETRPRYPAFLERPDQDVLLDDLTSRDVDEVGRLLHGPELGFAHESARLLRERGGQHYPVRFLEQFMQPVGAKHAVDVRGSARRVATQAEYAHVEPACFLGRLQADGPESDDAHGGAIDLLAAPALEPLVIALGLREAVHAARQHEHQGQHVLGDRDRGDAGGVGHHDVALRDLRRPEQPVHPGPNCLYPPQPGNRSQVADVTHSEDHLYLRS